MTGHRVVVSTIGCSVQRHQTFHVDRQPTGSTHVTGVFAFTQSMTCAFICPWRKSQQACSRVVSLARCCLLAKFTGLTSTRGVVDNLATLARFFVFTDSEKIGANFANRTTQEAITGTGVPKTAIHQVKGQLLRRQITSTHRV